jgi:hypothetical protein
MKVKLPYNKRVEIKSRMWEGAIKIVSMFLVVAVAAIALDWFFPRDLLPYRKCTVHQIEQKLKI